MMEALSRSRANFLAELLLGFLSTAGSSKCSAQYTADLPTTLEFPCGSAGARHPLIVRIVDKADIVASQSRAPSEQWVATSLSRCLGAAAPR